MKVVTSIFRIVSFCICAISLRAAESTNHIPEVIQFGVTHSTLIISGKFGPTSMGGGGATSQIEVGEVIKAPEDFRTPKSITLYWLSDKSRGLRLTNSYIFFLRPASTNADTGYHDVTEKVDPFVPATETNVLYLKSQITRR